MKNEEAMSGRERLDFVGFGALNVDVFYSLQGGGAVDQIVPDLHPGGEVIGDESKREQILKSAQEYAKFTGRSGGGQAANTAVALARMGFRCGFLGKVGNDEMGDFLTESLENVDKSHLKRGGDSGMCMCIVGSDGERANAVFPGCNDTITLDDSDVTYIKNSRTLYLTSFCNDNIVEVQRWLLEQDLGDTMVAFDPGEIYSRLGFDRLRKILELTHVLFATVDELELMTGKEPQKAAEEIIKCGTEIVVCKRSKQGADIITRQGSIFVPIAPDRGIVDKTGAGDVYAAGIIAGLLLELSLEDCGRLASEAAAISISAFGREKYPDREFLQKFLKHLRK